eukprot:scaffold241583_cov30-Tisochrysis_lutea.AAC.4
MARYHYQERQSTRGPALWRGVADAWLVRRNSGTNAQYSAAHYTQESPPALPPAAHFAIRLLRQYTALATTRREPPIVHPPPPMHNYNHSAGNVRVAPRIGCGHDWDTSYCCSSGFSRDLASAFHQWSHSDYSPRPMNGPQSGRWVHQAVTMHVPLPAVRAACRACLEVADRTKSPSWALPSWGSREALLNIMNVAQWDPAMATPRPEAIG